MMRPGTHIAAHRGTDLTQPLTDARRKVLRLCSPSQRRLLLDRWRKAAWVAAKRAADPERARAVAKLDRKRLVARGYYRKGGGGYYATKTSEKRRAYFRWYNANVRGCESTTPQRRWGNTLNTALTGDTP